MSETRSIVWRGIWMPGHEYARIFSENGARFLEGTAVFVFEENFCKLDYKIVCAETWETGSARVSGFIGARKIELEITVDADKNWRLNGEKIDGVQNCTDVDLNFSPVTNTLPIRRLNLKIGEKAPVRAAWLRFPGLTLERLDQVYERTDENAYRYESGGGSFSAEIETDGAGLVTNYPELWRIEKAG